jgi:probable addiction module antidote protein
MAQVIASTSVKRGGRTSSSSLAGRSKPNARTLIRRRNTGKTLKTAHPVSVSIESILDQRLSNSEEAVGYLNACLEDNDISLFLLSLQDVVRAQGGMSKISKKANLNREGMYDMLSKRGNPRLLSLEALLEALGLKLLVAQK